MNDVTLREQIVEHLDHNRGQTSEQLAEDIITIVRTYLQVAEEESRGDSI